MGSIQIPWLTFVTLFSGFNMNNGNNGFNGFGNMGFGNGMFGGNGGKYNTSFPNLLSYIA